MKVQGRRKRGWHKRRWFDRMRDHIKEKGLSGRKCTTVPYGGVYHRTSTPHQSEHTLKRKRKKRSTLQRLNQNELNAHVRNDTVV